MEELTRVNGVGMWNSWKRNFQTPLQALLDLLDNSFDATISRQKVFGVTNDGTDTATNETAIPDPVDSSAHSLDAFVGKINISSLCYDKYKKDSNDTACTERSGILIMNNSQAPVKPLKQVLEVYRSAKGKESETVGENGVGLKQGCATLSDLSFGITKHKNAIELGVIASLLQHEEGIRLPSFQLSQYHHNEDNDEEKNLQLLKEEIQRVTEKDPEVVECLKQLGNDSLDNGLNELGTHCSTLLSKEWGDHAFCLILTDLRHGGNYGAMTVGPGTPSTPVTNVATPANTFPDIASPAVTSPHFSTPAVRTPVVTSNATSAAPSVVQTTNPVPTPTTHGTTSHPISSTLDSTSTSKPTVTHVVSSISEAATDPNQTESITDPTSTPIVPATKIPSPTASSTDITPLPTTSESTLETPFKTPLDKIPDSGTSMHTRSRDKKSPKSLATPSTTPQKANLKKAKGLLKELKKKLPRFYIHVPPHFEFNVDSDPITFSYWQSRLVELSSFEIKVDPKNMWTSYDKKDEQKWKNPKDGYNMKLYMGFDPIRMDDPDISSAFFLYVYSRQSGRMIKCVEDARAEMGFVNSGSAYAQGLTVIIDDIEGRLPLNPTKQDIAFGEEEHGNAHKTNLFSWTSACIHFYWNHHANKFDGSKGVLGSKVKDFKDVVRKRTSATTNLPMLPLEKLELTKFSNIPWGKHKTKRIRALRKDAGTIVRGRSTKFRIMANPRLQTMFEDEELDGRGSSSKKNGRKGRKNGKHETSHLRDLLDDDVVPEEVLSSSKRRRTSRTKSPYFDADYDYDEDETTFEESLSNNKKGKVDDDEDYESMSDDMENDEGLLKEKIGSLEEELENTKKYKNDIKLDFETKMIERENKIERLKKKIAGMDRMMKAMVNSQSM